MNASEFDFQLPPELIAQHPARIRDESRLLEISREDRSWRDRQFRALPELLRAGDVLVVNDSRVIPGRLRAFRKDTGGPVECLLLEEVCTNQWWVMARPGKRLRAEHPICFRDRAGRETEIHARLLDRNQDGHCLLQFEGVADISHVLELIGELPLPPYIIRESTGPDEGDSERYQTVYARPAGSVAAPTAGLHFTQSALAEIASRGVEFCQVTLHVGAGTFAPVKVERLEDHVMHEERFHVPDDTADRVNRARAEGRRVIAVGTTSLRTLESAVQKDGTVRSGHGRTRLFLHPPATFGVTGALLTNFHLPKSTLLALVSAFASPGGLEGVELMRRAYSHAVASKYRFFSYGDAMFIH